ncbi:hypothetical protein ISN44_As06g006110 [Arabidopsis suecica]|uniref:Uncharacterized protein n=1 Tax=Arabidopsis suecica TaxID=45249 RepID=A0A8T2CCY8_ARASU|nr:hypothetical protein ISN44_As06g006110 [Arabidopsis suecica]
MKLGCYSVSVLDFETEPTLLISQVNFSAPYLFMEAAVATISVYWEIKGCPVPDGYDALRVGPSIKRNLRKFDYTGPITITAVGVLSEVPRDFLETTGEWSQSLSQVLVVSETGPTYMVSLFIDSPDSKIPRPHNTYEDDEASP